MANEKNPAVPSVPRSSGHTGPKTAGTRPFDAAGQYGRKESDEQASRLPGLPPEVYQREVVDYHEKLAEYTAKARGQDVPNAERAAERTSTSDASTPDTTGGITSKRGTR